MTPDQEAAIVEAVAEAIVAAEGEGHNDPPLYCDYGEAAQAGYRDIARAAIAAHIRALEAAGYVVAQREER